MTEHTEALPLLDIIEASERVRQVLGDMTLGVFEADWQKQWLIERGIEIISEASRRLTPDIKTKYPNIPWRGVAGIGNVLRHSYESISAPILWKLVREDLPVLEGAYRAELRRI